jgi:hypothetical protein
LDETSGLQQSVTTPKGGIMLWDILIAAVVRSAVQRVGKEVEEDLPEPVWIANHILIPAVARSAWGSDFS